MEAKRQARARAKEVAANFLTTARNKNCPGNCAQDQELDGDQEPEVFDIFAHEDADNNRWVAYAGAKWGSVRRCLGQPGGQAWNLDAATQELRYSGGEPSCGKTRVYSGCVICHASGSSIAKAVSKAKEGAFTRARELLTQDRARSCPNTCPGGSATGPEPDALTAESVRWGQQTTLRIFQATPTRYVAYAFVFWQVSIECPTQTSMRPRRRDEYPV